MKNKNYMFMAVVAGAMAIASVASAQSLTGEVRFGQGRDGSADQTDYRAEYWTQPVGPVVFGAELESAQLEDAGPVGALVSAKVGVPLPQVWEVRSVVYAEVGDMLVSGVDDEFYGLGVRASRQVYGPVSVTAGYRYRQAFDNSAVYDENRVNVGLSYAFNERVSAGVNYYRTTGTIDSDMVGVSLTRRF